MDESAEEWNERGGGDQRSRETSPALVTEHRRLRQGGTEDGELALARASQAKGVIQCITLNASYPLQQIIQTTTETGGDPGQPFFFQLYVNRDRTKSKAILSQCERISNIKAIFVTVDAAAAGKREADERVKLTDEDHLGGGATQAMIESESSGNTNTAKSKKSDAKGAGLTRIMGSYIDPGLVGTISPGYANTRPYPSYSRVS